MTTPAAWMLIPVALDQDSFAHPWVKLALRLDLRLLARGDVAFAEGWPVHVAKRGWEN